MKKAGHRRMFLAIGILLVIVGILIIWFHIPYSPIKNEFQKDISVLMADNQLSDTQDIFTARDFSNLPIPIQKYIENCGYIGTPKISYMKMEYSNVNFSQGRNGPTLIIDYTQYNFVNEPCRMAFIDSGMFGVPFEGYDYYQNGTGGMKGVIAKAITLFNQTGADMDKACLVTFLAESLFAPTILLQDYIVFEEINDLEVQATINYKGQTASGIFTFNEQYEMISFTTNDRAVAEQDGSMNYVPWSAHCSNYQLSDDGIKHPTQFQAIWHYPDEEFIYFDGIINEVAYG